MIVGTLFSYFELATKNKTEKRVQRENKLVRIASKKEVRCQRKCVAKESCLIKREVDKG